MKKAKPRLKWINQKHKLWSVIKWKKDDSHKAGLNKPETLSDASYKATKTQRLNQSSNGVHK